MNDTCMYRTPRGRFVCVCVNIYRTYVACPEKATATFHDPNFILFPITIIVILTLSKLSLVPLTV